MESFIKMEVFILRSEKYNIKEIGKKGKKMEKEYSIIQTVR